MNNKMIDPLLLKHPQLEDILITVKRMKLAGRTVPKICHELSRNFKPPDPHAHAWDARYVFQCFEILRKNGDLPQSALQTCISGRSFYHDMLAQVAKNGLRSNR